jgi:tryptophan-rich sensory protein
VHSIEMAFLVRTIIFGLIAIGLWIWMAKANGDGYRYARIVGTVFFGLNTLLTLLTFTVRYAGLGLVLNILVWLVGLGAVLMIWHKESAPYYDRGRPQ